MGRNTSRLMNRTHQNAQDLININYNLKMQDASFVFVWLVGYDARFGPLKEGSDDMNAFRVIRVR